MQDELLQQRAQKREEREAHCQREKAKIEHLGAVLEYHELDGELLDRLKMIQKAHTETLDAEKLEWEEQDEEDVKDLEAILRVIRMCKRQGKKPIQGDLAGFDR